MLYDGYDCVADYDDSGTPALLRYYITPMLDENLLVYDEENTDEEYFYVHDGLGTVRQILDENQNIENSYDFEGFGTEISASENIYNRYRYTGRVFDAETESANSEALYYYRA